MIVWRPASRRINPRTSPICRGSSPMVGSSSMRTSGSPIKSLGDADPLSIPFRQRFDERTAPVGDVGRFGHSLGFGGKEGAFIPFNAGDEGEIFPHPHVAVKRGRFGEVADPAFGGQRLLGHIVTEDVDPPLGRGQVAGDHPHGSGLPGAVGSQKPADLPFFDRKGDVVDGDPLAVALRQTGYGNQLSLPW